jgi:HEAT repeat protein
MIQKIDRQLGSADVDLRREAVLRLKELGSGSLVEDAVKLMLRAMQDPSWRVRKTSVDILFTNYSNESYMKGLLNLLQLEDNAGARNSAIELFIKLGRKCTKFLMEAFDTPNTDLRKFILDILGQIVDKDSIPLLIKALKDEDENVKASAVEQLGNMKEPSVVYVLMDILKSGDLWTAYPAADALGRIGAIEAVPALMEALDNKTLREPAIRALGMIADESSVRRIVDFIEDKSKAVKHEALRALEMLYHSGVSEEVLTGAIREGIGDRAIDLLLVHAKSNRPEVRVSSILLLGLLRNERSLRPLLELSEDEEFVDDIRKALIFIGRVKPESLLPLFETENPYHKRFICDVASEVASPELNDILERFIEDEDGHVRAAAAIGISRIGNLGAIRKIRNLLRDPYVDVQEAALKALGNMKDGIDVNDVLMDINTKNPVLRRNIVLLLGELGQAKTVSVLGFMLKDEDFSVRRAVITALSKIKTHESFRHISQALTDEDTDIRMAAVLSLGMTGDGSYVDDLLILLKDTEDMVKVSAAKALGTLGESSAVPALIRLLSDENGFVVTAAIDAIGKLGGEAAKEALRRMLPSNDREIRRSAIRALSGFAGVESEVLPFIDDNDWATRVAVVESLEGIKDDRVRTEIEKHYDSEEDTIVRNAMEKFLSG